MTLRRTVLAAALAAAALAPSAQADGGPSPGVYQGPNSLVDGVHGLRYATVPAGFQTVVEQIRTDGGAIVRLRTISGDFGLPLVTWSGDIAGLSPDGKLLVLGGRPTGGAGLSRTSRFLVLDASTLKLRRSIVLRGDFSFDAISPDRKTLYLIQHSNARDLQRYRVRAYDLVRNELRRGAIVDKTEPNMRGFPYARLPKRDGSWVYTLYQGGKESFVHALDAVHGRALCLDIDWKKQDGKLWRMKLRFLDGGRRLGFVDRKTGRRARPTLDLNERSASGIGTGWIGLASGATLAAVAILLWRRRVSGAAP